MGNSYIAMHVHVVFRTKNREPWLAADVRETLYPYLGGVARDERLKLLAIGGTEDHVHMLLSLPAETAVSRMMQALKTAASRWIHETFPRLPGFAWQEGYGAFSVGVSQLEATKAYIHSQIEHHRETSFLDEYKTFLEKHGLAYEERYL